MKKAIFTFSFFLIGTLSIFAQKLTITEIDAPENAYYNDSSQKALGKEMNISLTDNKLSIKVDGKHEIILNQVSDKYFESQQTTKDGLIKYAVKVYLKNSLVTAAEFTSTIVPENKSKKTIWWTVTARQSPVVPIVTSL